MKRQTTYNKAVNYLHNSLILCNDITNLEDDYLDFRFDLDDNDTIYQFFLTDCSEADVIFLENTFDLKFAYSTKLDLYVLCVDHFGTLWDGVPCDCLNDDIPDENL